MAKSSHLLVIDRFDPVARLLFFKLGFGVLGVVVLQWVLGAVELLALPWNYIPIWNSIFLIAVMPIFWGYYALTRHRIPRLHGCLKENKILVDIEIDQFRVFVNKFKASYSSLVISVIALVCGSLYVIFTQFVLWKNQPPPFPTSGLHAVYSHIWVFFSIYVSTLTVIRELIAIYWLNYFFRHFSIQIHPLHPDGAGGLGFIGNHYLGLTLLIIAIGYWLSFLNFLTPLTEGQPLNLNFEVIVGWILFLIAAPFSFFVPLWSAHLAMKRNKMAKLQVISEQYDSDIEHIQSNLNLDVTVLEKRTKKATELYEIYQMTNKIHPTWPYSAQTLRRFSLSALLPVIQVGIMVYQVINSPP